MLVCANSNAACDEITERLVDHLQQRELLRLYAKSFETDQISPKIQLVSNLRKGEIKFPSLEIVYGFRVVICTLLTAGSLIRAREIDGNFNSSHFLHIIIDEAASSHELVTFIPIGKWFKTCFKTFLFKEAPLQMNISAISNNVYSKKSFLAHITMYIAYYNVFIRIHNQTSLLSLK